MHPDVAAAYENLRFYTQPRDALMGILTNADLRFTPSDKNPTLGELCRQLGETQHIYVESFRTFSADFSYRNADIALANDITRLVAWYAELDAALESVFEALSDDDLLNKTIQRGEFQVAPLDHLEIYREALLLFYGRVHVYLLAMGNPLPEIWQAWFT
jgi:hypothetical protein